MFESGSSSLSIGQCATLACLLEVNAPKVGNVHRGADFDDATLNDFAASAVAMGGVLDQCNGWGVGAIVLDCVKATRRVCDTNTNLGTVLLIAPLASVGREQSLRTGMSDVLKSLTPDDAEAVYAAIRLANPGGLGDAEQWDVGSAAPESLLKAMKLAADRDLVAGEYATEYSLTFNRVVPAITGGVESGLGLPAAIVQTQIGLLAEFGDSLIARKCGDVINHQVQARAERVLQAGKPSDEAYAAALADFDFWLRSDGRRRNPGTTADLIAAGLFVCLRDTLIAPPLG